jgi:hypothetical protein
LHKNISLGVATFTGRYSYNFQQWSTSFIYWFDIFQQLTWNERQHRVFHIYNWSTFLTPYSYISKILSVSEFIINCY